MNKRQEIMIYFMWVSIILAIFIAQGDESSKFVAILSVIIVGIAWIWGMLK